MNTSTSTTIPWVAWNNRGVQYLESGHLYRALYCFRYALQDTQRMIHTIHLHSSSSQPSSSDLRSLPPPALPPSPPVRTNTSTASKGRRTSPAYQTMTSQPQPQQWPWYDEDTTPTIASTTSELDWIFKGIPVVVMENSVTAPTNIESGIAGVMPTSSTTTPPTPPTTATIEDTILATYSIASAIVIFNIAIAYHIRVAVSAAATTSSSGGGTSTGGGGEEQNRRHIFLQRRCQSLYKHSWTILSRYSRFISASPPPPRIACILDIHLDKIIVTAITLNMIQLSHDLVHTEETKRWYYQLLRIMNTMVEDPCTAATAGDGAAVEASRPTTPPPTTTTRTIMIMVNEEMDTTRSRLSEQLVSLLCAVVLRMQHSRGDGSGSCCVFPFAPAA